MSTRTAKKPVNTNSVLKFKISRMTHKKPCKNLFFSQFHTRLYFMVSYWKKKNLKKLPHRKKYLKDFSLRFRESKHKIIKLNYLYAVYMIYMLQLYGFKSEIFFPSSLVSDYQCSRVYHNRIHWNGLEKYN